MFSYFMSLQKRKNDDISTCEWKKLHFGVKKCLKTCWNIPLNFLKDVTLAHFQSAVNLMIIYICRNDVYMGLVYWVNANQQDTGFSHGALIRIFTLLWERSSSEKCCMIISRSCYSGWNEFRRCSWEIKAGMHICSAGRNVFFRVCLGSVCRAWWRFFRLTQGSPGL